MIQEGGARKPSLGEQEHFIGLRIHTVHSRTVHSRTVHSRKEYFYDL